MKYLRYVAELEEATREPTEWLYKNTTNMPLFINTERTQLNQTDIIIIAVAGAIVLCCCLRCWFRIED